MQYTKIVWLTALYKFTYTQKLQKNFIEHRTQLKVFSTL